MSPIDLRNVLRRQPFSPMQLTFTDGSKHIIAHPEMAFLTRSTVSIGHASDPESGMQIRHHISRSSTWFAWIPSPLGDSAK